MKNFGLKCNPHLPFCICKLCNNIIRRPTIVVPCEHSFCLPCIIPTVEGKLLTEAKCPTCKGILSPNNIQSSKKTLELLSSLTLPCIKKCGTIFPVSKYTNLLEHQKSCIIQPSISPSLSLSNLFEIEHSSEITKDVDDAVLHVILYINRQGILRR